MKNLIWHWVISSLALWLAVEVLRGVSITHWYDVLWVAPLLGLVNLVVGGLARIISWIAFPVNLLTLGCFGFLLSFFAYVVAIKYLGSLPNFPLRLEESHSFYWAVLLAIIMALFSSLLNMVLPGKPGKNRDR